MPRTLLTGPGHQGQGPCRRVGVGSSWSASPNAVQLRRAIGEARFYGICSPNASHRYIIVWFRPATSERAFIAPGVRIATRGLRLSFAAVFRTKPRLTTRVSVSCGDLKGPWRKLRGPCGQPEARLTGSLNEGASPEARRSGNAAGGTGSDLRNRGRVAGGRTARRSGIGHISPKGEV